MKTKPRAKLPMQSTGQATTSVAKRGKSGKPVYIINDYGHLVMITADEPVQPWKKVVASLVKSPRPGEQVEPPKRLAENNILKRHDEVPTRYPHHGPDKNWEWRPSKRG